MKQIVVLALAALTFASCQQKTVKTTTETGADIVVKQDTAVNQNAAIVPAADAAVLTFENANYNFGTIAQGEKVSYAYKFKNTGKSPLIITNAEASCGCTVPEIPKEPIKPGATGEIKVVFNSEGKKGKQDKVVTITSNANPTTAMVHLTGEIKEH